ncbi:DUF1275 family protein, partial [Gluconobacter potus]
LLKALNAQSTGTKPLQVQTGMLTDVGLELADWLESFFHPVDPVRRTGTRERLGLHAAIVLSFTLGGVAGAFLYGWWSALFLLALAGLLACLALPGALSHEPVAEHEPALVPACGEKHR